MSVKLNDDMIKLDKESNLKDIDYERINYIILDSDEGDPIFAYIDNKKGIIRSQLFNYIFPKKVFLEVKKENFSEYTLDMMIVFKEDAEKFVNSINLIINDLKKDQQNYQEYLKAKRYYYKQFVKEAHSNITMKN